MTEVMWPAEILALGKDEVAYFRSSAVLKEENLKNTHKQCIWQTSST